MKEYIIESTDYKVFKNGIFFFKQKHEPLAVAATAHIHSSIEIIFVREGSYTVWLDDKKYNIFAGDVILFRSNTIHHIMAKEEPVNYYYVLKIKPEVIRDLALPETAGVYIMNFVGNRFASKCLWTRREVENGVSMIRQGLEILVREFGTEEVFADISFKIATGFILLGMMRTGAAVSKVENENNGEVVDAIYKVVVYINNHYSDEINAKQMCTLAGMSYSYFSRSFRRIVGKSFKEYLNSTRINQAEHLLTTTNKTVNEICMECGYNDVSYFIKVFRELKGYPPGVFKLIRK